MRLLKKIWFSIIIIISIIVLYNKESYGENTPPNIDVDTLINSFNTPNSYLEKEYYAHLYNNGIYCISRGRGMGRTDLTLEEKIEKYSGIYTLTKGIKIDKSGLAYTYEQYGEKLIKTLKWNDMNNTQKKVARKMYYILDADKKYGQGYNLSTAEELYYLTNVYEKNELGYVEYKTENQRQFSIWNNIDDFIEAFFSRADIGISINQENGNGTKTCELLEESTTFSQNTNEIKNTVYFWQLISNKNSVKPIIKAPSWDWFNDIVKDEDYIYYVSGEDIYYQNGVEQNVNGYYIYKNGTWQKCSTDDVPFCQDLMLVGKRTTQEQTTLGSIIIYKRDENQQNNQSLLDGTRFALAKYTNGKYYYLGYETISNGQATFNNLTEGKYGIFELSAISGYSLNPDNIKVENPNYTVHNSNFIDGLGILFERPLCYEFNVSKNNNNYSINVYNKKENEDINGSITVKKRDYNQQSNQSLLDGTRFALAKKHTDEKYYYLGYGTISNGQATFRNLTKGTYAIFELSAISGYSLNPETIIVDNKQVKNNTFIDGNGQKFSRPLCKEFNIETSYNYEITVYNKKINGEITINKRDGSDNSKNLDGIKFALTKKLSNGEFLYQKMGTTYNGKVKFSNLDLGTYAIFEWETVDGYSLKAKDIQVEYNNTKDTAKDSVFKDYTNKTFRSILCKEITISENSTEVSITVYNNKYGGIKIQKKDRYNQKKLQGVGFALYKMKNGNYNYIAYTLPPTNILGETSSDSISPGEYVLFEVKNPNPGYNIRYQGQRYDPKRGAYIGIVKIEAGKTTEVNNLTYSYKAPNDQIEKYVSFADNELFVTLNIKKYYEGYDSDVHDIVRKKVNESNHAGFTLYKDDKPVQIRKAESTEYTTEFITDKEGTAKIERIPVNATYTIYETKFPEWKYNGEVKRVNPEIQPGYDPKTGYVKIGTIKVDSEGNITNLELENDTSKKIKVKLSDNTIVYRNYRSKSIIKDKSNGKESQATIEITNHRYINIAGTTWEDIDRTKEPGFGDNLLLTDKDIPISKMTVKLCKRDGTVVETTKTDSAGKYKLTTPLLLEEVKNGDYYVAFDYNPNNPSNTEMSIANKIAKTIEEYQTQNKFLYVPVEPNLTKKQGSKAMSEYVLPKDDSKIITDNYYNAFTGYRRAERN